MKTQPPVSSAGWNKKALALVSLVVLGLVVALAFSPTFTADFVNWDDDRFFRKNPLFAGPVADYIRAAIGSVQFEAYQPVHLLSYLPDRLFWSESPNFFHILNVCIFFFDCALLLALVRRHAAWWAALAATLIFAVHPLRVESVAWITARKDLVALFFVLLVLLIEDRISAQKASSAPSTRSLRAVSIVLTGIAILAKSNSVVIPFLLLANLRWLSFESWRESIKRVIPHILISCASSILVIKLWTDHKLILPSRPLAFPLDVAGTVGFYLEKVLFPSSLSPVYASIVPHQIALGVAWLAAFGLLLYFWKKLPRWGRIAAFVFHAALLPTVNLIPMYFRFADRYALFACVGIVVPMAIAFDEFGSTIRRKQTITFGVAFLILVLAIQSRELSASWRSSLSLWTHATAVQPTAFYGHLKLAETFREEGNKSEAVKAYLRASMFTPRSAIALAGLFVSSCELAEDRGSVSKGECLRWEAALKKTTSQRELQELINKVESGGCERCAQTLLWLALNMFPPSDSELIQLAQAAAAKKNQMALEIYLRELSTRTPEKR